MELADKIKQVPRRPGVYRFLNTDGTIIYIGKAKNLRNRVRSYFQKNKYQTAKNQSLISRIADVEWIVVDSEVEALLTEANLIKEHKPRYNIDLKDDKSFPYIRITKEPFPQVFLTRDVVRDGSTYFGPYTDVFLLKQSLKAIHKIFTIRSCSYRLDAKTITKGKVTLCLDYHIKKCGGPCEGKTSTETYNEMIQRVKQFLHGHTKPTEDYLHHAMVRASQDLRYEDAAIHRDQLNAVRAFKERQRKVAADFGDRDVFAFWQENDYGVGVILRIRQGRLLGREKLSFRGGDGPEQVLASLMTRFYLESDWIPGDISLPLKPEAGEEIRNWLKSKRRKSVRFHVPQRGEKAREIRLAEQNAKLLVGEWELARKKRQDYVPNSVASLQDDLQLNAPPRRIEAFDISHLGGTDTVASMVCFKDGKPRKSEYRKFTVKTVTGIDDFASMREVVYRRYKRAVDEDQILPDLILIDGGKGQLSMAVSALRELGLTTVPVVGLAKRLEEVFVPGESEPKSIAKHSPGLILLRRVRDEAHRFAINYQRQKRKKRVTTSVFETIPGMGHKRVELLLSKYASLRDMGEATPEEVHQTTGLPMKLAEKIVALAREVDGSGKDTGLHS
ncbi:MAG: excinuclease ABC subunit C [FCB group bacterium]|nr:excinuclease ABC subunit C [FCB group bacterium]